MAEIPLQEGIARLITLLTSPVPTQETNPIIVTPIFRPAVAVRTTVTLSNVSALALPANLDRRRLILANDSGTAIYVAFSATCSLAAFSFRLAANETYQGPMGDYTGPVSAIRASGTSALQVTEIITA